MKKNIITAAIATVAAATVITGSAAKPSTTKPAIPAEFSDIYSVPCTVVEITDRVTIADRSCPSLTWSFDAAETFGCDPFTVGDDVRAILWDYEQNFDMRDDMVVNVCYDHSRLAQ